MDPELKAYLDAMRESLVARMMDLNKETREHSERLHAQAIEHAGQLHVEARVLIEAVQREVQLVADGVATVNGKLDRIANDHEQRIQRLERRVP